MPTLVGLSALRLNRVRLHKPSPRAARSAGRRREVRVPGLIHRTAVAHCPAPPMARDCQHTRWLPYLQITEECQSIDDAAQSTIARQRLPQNLVLSATSKETSKPNTLMGRLFSSSGLLLKRLDGQAEVPGFQKSVRRPGPEDDKKLLLGWTCINEG